MFKRIFSKSMKNRRDRLVVAVLAVVMGAAMVAALVSVSMDINQKIGRELRAYGANLVLVPAAADQAAGGGTLDLAALRDDQYLREAGLTVLEQGEVAGSLAGYAPYLYGIVRVAGEPVVLAGTRFDAVRKISPWWKVQGDWVTDRGGGEEAIIGVNVAAKLGLKPGDRFEIQYSRGENAVTRTLLVKGTVETGGPEDNQVFVNLIAAQEMLDRPGLVYMVQVSALSYKEPVEDIALKIEALLPGAKAKVVKQIARAEGNVLNKIQWLMLLVTGVVLVASGMSVASTMTTTVLERRKEIGLMKALGAENRRIATLFFAEAGAIGIMGGLLGYFVGLGLAQVIGWQVFDTAISWRGVVFPVTVGVAVLVALVASRTPVKTALHIDPVVTLRGD